MNIKIDKLIDSFMIGKFPTNKYYLNRLTQILFMIHEGKFKHFFDHPNHLHY